MGNSYKLQTHQVWVTLSHPASATDFSSCAYDGEPNGTIRGPPEATVPPHDMIQFTAILLSTFTSLVHSDCDAE